MPRHPPQALISLAKTRKKHVSSSEEDFSCCERELVFFQRLRFFAQWLTLTFNYQRSYRLSALANQTSMPGRVYLGWAVALSRPHQKNGGGGRNRTDDLLRAKQSLSQLSYTPGCREVHAVLLLRDRPEKWWAWVDLNYRPHAYQACALTN